MSRLLSVEFDEFGDKFFDVFDGALRVGSEVDFLIMYKIKASDKSIDCLGEQFDFGGAGITIRVNFVVNNAIIIGGYEQNMTNGHFVITV